MPLSDRDRRALLWGGAAIAVLVLYLLLRGGDSAPAAEPVQADVQATTPAPTEPIVTAVAPPVQIVSAPAADVSQLRLVGILSRGALIAMADGTQRFVPVGREIVPGVILRGVDVHHAILATPSGEVRLALDQAAQGPLAAAPVAQSRILPTP